MPRRKSGSFKRPVAPDVRYGSKEVEKLINIVMWCGKKNIARKIVYDALDILIKKAGDTEKGLALFHKGLDLLMPAVEVRPRRVGGSVYQIPKEVAPHRARALAMRWLIKAAAERSDKTMGGRLAHEILDASEGRGSAAKRKSDVHRMADANRAFSHYSW